MSVISIIAKFAYLIQINIPLIIPKWLPLLGYCGVQYSECSASDSMSINVAETGDESEIGSNCAEECSNRGGTAGGNCAGGYGVCCVCEYQNEIFLKYYIRLRMSVQLAYIYFRLIYFCEFI